MSDHPAFEGQDEARDQDRAAIVDRCPGDTCSPETTKAGRFLHPIGMSGALEKATIGFIVRDFTDEGRSKRKPCSKASSKSDEGLPHSTYRMEVKPQYRNMKQVIDRHPEIVDYAIEAIRRAGLTPCAARSAAAPTVHGCVHGPTLPQYLRRRARLPLALEWVSRQTWKAAETIVHLAMIWEERA